MTTLVAFLRHPFAFALLLLLGASPAAAQSRPVQLAMLDGACGRLIVAGKDFSKDCAGKLLNTNYADSRTGFYFVTARGGALTFSGLGSKQTKPDPDTAIQPIDKVIISMDGKTRTFPAAGECKYTNPTKGPAPIACSAKAANGLYEAAFVSDGNPPTVKELR